MASFWASESMKERLPKLILDHVSAGIGARRRKAEAVCNTAALPRIHAISRAMRRIAEDAARICHRDRRLADQVGRGFRHSQRADAMGRARPAADNATGPKSDSGK